MIELSLSPEKLIELLSPAMMIELSVVSAIAKSPKTLPMIVGAIAGKGKNLQGSDSLSKWIDARWASALQ